jgi:putative transposase
MTQPPRPTHRPPHLDLEAGCYWLTAATVHRQPLLTTAAHRQVWRTALRALTAETGVALHAWVVLPNHYHVLFERAPQLTLSQWVKRLHGRTAQQLNRLDATPGRQVWYNYWDTVIRGERDFWTRVNYVHYNPVKHGYVADPAAWPFSSYGYYRRTQGADWLAGQHAAYPPPSALAHDEF